MVRWMISVVLLVGSFATVGGVAAAYEVGDVKAAVEKWISALNEGDVAALVPYYYSEETSFDGIGGLLAECAHSEARLKITFEAGFKSDLQWRHLDVKVLGKAAVVTGYLVGAVTQPGGTLLQNSWRTSVMLVRRDEK